MRQRHGTTPEKSNGVGEFIWGPRLAELPSVRKDNQGSALGLAVRFGCKRLANLNTKSIHFFARSFAKSSGKPVVEPACTTGPSGVPHATSVINRRCSETRRPNRDTTLCRWASHLACGISMKHTSTIWSNCGTANPDNHRQNPEWKGFRFGMAPFLHERRVRKNPEATGDFTPTGKKFKFCRPKPDERFK